MASAIVTSTYRKRKSVPLEGPAIVTKRATPLPQASTPKPANDDRKSAIVTISEDGPASGVVGSDTAPSGIDTPRSQPAAVTPRSAIVTAKRRRSRFSDAPDLTSEEHQRRGEAADTLFRESVRRTTE